MNAAHGVADLEELVMFVQSRQGTDLSKYRRSCLARRVGIRMTSVRCRSLEDYMEYIDKHPEEVNHLLDVVTIHVTDFFRDRDVFEALAHRVLPEIIGQKLLDGFHTVRIWSAGCSTGEETYSIAIMLLELIRREGLDMKPRIFGTDISAESCEYARRGIFGDRKACGIPGHLLRRYFEIDDSSCTVSQEVKRHVKFRVHDLFSKPPFTMLDLVVCRNVLIHFNQEARSVVLGNFNSVLNQGGILVLGKSEAMSGPDSRVFELIDARNKIYQKVATGAC